MGHIRRNHALEHATINLLSRHHPDAQIAGLSGPHGFTLYSSLTPEEIISAARQALGLLKAGQSELALHKNCGTNLVTTAAMTTLATIVGLGEYALPANSPRRRLSGFVRRLPQVLLLNVVALVAALPLARWIQANITTNPDVQDLEIAAVFTNFQGNVRRVRVHTRIAAGAV